MTPIEIARDAWGPTIPDYVEALGLECTRFSQVKVAQRLGRSGALVSQVLRNKYRGDMIAVEELVRGVLLNARVECPALGPLPTNECQVWRRKSREFATGNPLRRRMYRACGNCPRNRQDDPQTEEEATQ